MPCMWCLPSTTLPFYTIKVRVSSPPLAGHHIEGMDGTSIVDHALCVVHLTASPYDGISPTAMMVCRPPSGGTRGDQHRGHAESVIRYMEGIQMYKDIVISILGALLLEPVFNTTGIGEQIAITIGLATVLFIFCLFCEILEEKWRKKCRRVREMEQRIAKLRGGKTSERRKSATDHESIGDGAGHATNDAC